jgi:hypothetical protein
MVLGEVLGDTSGGAVYAWEVPLDVELGVHTFRVAGPFSGEAVTPEFEVVSPAAPIVEALDEPVAKPVALAKTGMGPGVLKALQWTMAALALGWFLVLIAGRRRRRDTR